MARRIGIFPGTFHPIHQGHIAFALAAATTCDLQTVYFLPEHTPRGKHCPMALSDRVQYIDTAIEQHSRLDRIVLDDSQFTVARTLPLLRNQFPDTQLTLLIGSDVAHSLPHWDDIGDLVPHVEFAIGIRSDHSATDINAVLQNSGTGHPIRYKIITSPHADLSSTKVRGYSIRNLS